MNWIKHKNGNYSVPNYPYFWLIIEDDKDFRKRFGHCLYGYYETVEKAKIACIKFNIQRLQYIESNNMDLFTYQIYSDNKGYGKYLSKEYYNKYQWLISGEITSSSIFNQHGIRFGINIPESVVIAHGRKIQKRHIKRFLKDVNNIK